MLIAALLASPELLGASQALAAWSSNTVVNTPVVTTAGHQQFPTAVSDGSGGIVTVWRDDAGTLWAQRHNANGNRLWPATGVSFGNGNVAQDFEAVSDGSGGVVVLWYELDSQDEADIYAQKIDGSGTVAWAGGERPVCTAASDQYILSAAPDGSGGAVVAWQDLRNSSKVEGFWDVYAQRIGADGNPAWTTDGLAVSQSAGPQLNPRVLGQADGGAIIAWEGLRTDADTSTHDQVRVQKISPEGQLQWGGSGRVLSTYAPFWYSEEPRPVSDGAGGAIVAWKVYEGSAARALRAQRVTAAGTVAWAGEALVSGSDFFVYDSLRLVADQAGGAIASWIDTANGQRILAQRLTAGGVAAWGGGKLASWSTGPYINSHVLASDGAGGAIATWVDDRTGGFDVFAQRIDASGARVWRTAVSSAVGDQNLPSIVGDGIGGATMAWTDGRTSMSTGLDVYAQRIMPDGKPPAALVVQRSTGGDVAVSQGTLDWTGRTGSAAYARGTLVTLSATPRRGYAFDGWDGACAAAGTATECTLDMSLSRKALATFIAL